MSTLIKVGLVAATAAAVYAALPDIKRYITMSQM
jgi:hypothetical protein